MERYPEASRTVDARFASWLKTNSPTTVAYHMSCGLSLPEREKAPHGLGPGWQGRALAAVLRECYRLGLQNQTLEEVEIVTLCVLPAPEDDGGDDRLRPPFMPSIQAKWEEAVRLTAEAVHRILRHGPASGAAGGERLFAGGVLKAEVGGLSLEQRVDLLWRRPDGGLEAVLVVEEPLVNGRPHPARDDWRCVLAAAIVRALYDQNPDIHTVWVTGAAGRVAHIPDGTLDGRLGDLSRILEQARVFGGLDGTGQEVFYRLAEETEALYKPRGKRRGQRSTGSAQRKPD